LKESRTPEPDAEEESPGPEPIDAHEAEEAPEPEEADESFTYIVVVVGRGGSVRATVNGATVVVDAVVVVGGGIVWLFWR